MEAASVPPVEERRDPLAEFPPDLQRGAIDLTYLGHLTERIEFCGYTFVLETIRPYMKNILGQALEPWRNTIQEPQAWAALNVSMALQSVNGKTDFCPQTQDNPLDFTIARYNWITGPQGFWEPTITFLFGKYAEMEQQVIDYIAELHRLSQRGRDTL